MVSMVSPLLRHLNNIEYNNMDKVLVIKQRLQYDHDFMLKCLLKLYEQQEEDEKAISTTQHTNGRGFNKADAPYLTRCVELYKAEKNLVLSRRIEAAERLKKYAKQLSTLIELT